MNPAGRVIRRDLAADPLPHVDEAWTEVDVIVLQSELTDLDALGELLQAPAHRESWARTRALVDELLAADVILLGTPMYNRSVASSLKAWLDNVTFPWLPLTGKRAVVATHRGGTYPAGTPRVEEDHQEPFLRT